MNVFESRYLGIPCYSDTDMDVPSLYPQTPLIRPKQRICYENMYEMERIKRTMKVGTKVTPIQPKNPELFGKIGTVVSATVEHGCGLYPTATVEVVFDGFPGSFDFNPNKLALVNVTKMEESIMKIQKNALPGIKKVIYNGPKTIVLWADNTKTIVSCEEYNRQQVKVAKKIAEYTRNDVIMTEKAYEMLARCIVKVIFNDPATIVLWGDGTKTVVKAKNEPFDPEKGLAMAIAKKHFGNTGCYYEVFKRWLPKEE